MPSLVLRGILNPSSESRLVSYTDRAAPPWSPRWLRSEGEGDGVRLTMVQVASTVLFRGFWPLLGLQEGIPFEVRDSLLPGTLVKATIMSYRDVAVEIAIVICD